MEVGPNHQQLALVVFSFMYTCMYVYYTYVKYMTLYVFPCMYIYSNYCSSFDASAAHALTDELSATNQCTHSTLHCAHANTVDMCMVKV